MHSKKMSLNYKKSGYMIINGDDGDIKSNLKMESGYLKYKKSQKYLGAIFTDCGVIKDDVGKFLVEKNKQVSVKLANFIYRNKYTPIMAKLKVVKACINSSLTYACETWGNCVEV